MEIFYVHVDLATPNPIEKIHITGFYRLVYHCCSCNNYFVNSFIGSIHLYNLFMPSCVFCFLFFPGTDSGRI